MTARITARAPICTYRIQFNKDFNFRDALAQVDYLDRLGITDLYASPFLAARPGSVHGYDIIDHSRLNPEIGTEDDLDALAAALRSRAMGMLEDVVPNHMCIATSDNPWWNDVLENGRSSPYAEFFDIDWFPPKSELHDKVLLPVLGAQYGRVLENQEIAIGYGGGAFHARYYDKRYPIGPRTILPLLEPMVEDVRRSHPPDHPELLELESILTATKHLPTRWETDPERVRERMREKEIVKRRIDALVSSSAAVREALERSVAAINGEKGKPRTFDRLEALLADQAYRLSYWGVAAEEINYRRFFDINDLAAIRVEDPKVLEAVHAKTFELLRQGKVTGLRVDHVDGLYEPSRYLESLQRHPLTPPQQSAGALPHSAAAGDAGHPASEGSPPATPADDVNHRYVVVEKILTGAESLPASWPIAGTTGYEFMNQVNGLFVDPTGARAIERFYERLRNDGAGFDDQLYEAKKLILSTAMSSELFVLGGRLDRISEQHRWSRDFTRSTLQFALGEVIACFPVYRTYVLADSTEVTPGDRQHVAHAIRDAKRRNRSISESIFEFIADILLLRDPDGLSEADRRERREFVLRVQQLTGPVMAKGLEDTVFYRYFPLASLNEVGGRPSGVGVDVDRFHTWNLRRAAQWPHGLSATATHDTKRGEDTRVRLDVLSEMPRDWQHAVRRWQRQNRSLKSDVEDASVPDSNEEYLIYQTLVGVWPADAIANDLTDESREALLGRVRAYLTKALREAKQKTSWINVNEPYERAVDQFVCRLLTPPTGSEFMSDLRRFLAKLVMPGIYNSLAQVAIKITAPGVPDFYQGTELWDLSLVDPDNRRAVDYAARRALLEKINALSEEAVPGFIADALGHADGALKLLVTARALAHRRRHRDLYADGEYVPLPAEGARPRNIVAYARASGGASAIVMAGRFLAELGAASAPPVGEAAWGDTRLVLPPSVPPGLYRDVLTGRSVAARPNPDGTSPALHLSDAFVHLPVALLERAD